MDLTNGKDTKTKDNKVNIALFQNYKNDRNKQERILTDTPKSRSISINGSFSINKLNKTNHNRTNIKVMNKIEEIK